MARFRVGDKVIGTDGPYMITNTGYIGEVLKTLKDGAFYISTDYGCRAEGTYDGMPYYKVHEEYFRLVEPNGKLKTTTNEPIEEIDYDATPQKGDLVRFLSKDEIINKYKGKYIDKTKKAGVGYNIRAYINDKYYPVYEEEIEGYIEFLQSKKYRTYDFITTYAGKHGVVKKIDARYGELTIRSLDPHETADFGFYFSEEQVVVVERNYAEKEMKEKKKQRNEEKQSLLKDEIIQEMISKVDKNNMKRILSASLKLNASKITGIDDVVLEWAAAKKDLYLLLNKNLKITVEKEMDMSRDEKALQFSELTKKFPGQLYLAYNSTDTSTIIENKISSRSSMFSFIQDRVEGINAGISLTTFMHKVFNDKNLDTELSKFFESTKTKGYITISIDPVDYMLMSMNNSGWQSCHSLCKLKTGVNMGEYSAGVFSYMCDKTSLISFRHTKNELENIVINNTKIKGLNKNWRQMVYVNLEHKFFVCSREYPKSNEPAAKFVREEVEALISKRYGIPNEWKVTSGKVLDDVVVNTPRPGTGFDYELHYNDMYHQYDGKMVYQVRLADYDGIKIEIGSYPTCPICGREQLKEHYYPFCKLCKKDDIFKR